MWREDRNPPHWVSLLPSGPVSGKAGKKSSIYLPLRLPDTPQPSHLFPDIRSKHTCLPQVRLLLLPQAGIKAGPSLQPEPGGSLFPHIALPERLWPSAGWKTAPWSKGPSCSTNWPIPTTWLPTLVTPLDMVGTPSGRTLPCRPQSPTPLPLVLSLHTSKESLGPPSLQTPYREWKAYNIGPSLSISRLNNQSSFSPSCTPHSLSPHCSLPLTLEGRGKPQN